MGTLLFNSILDEKQKALEEKMSNYRPQQANATLNAEAAQTACESFGRRWRITRKTPGSAVCSIVTSDKNCHGCNSWRLLVWKDGACDRLRSSKCRFNSTKAGKYYCGYDPCLSGDLVYGGMWGNSDGPLGSFMFLLSNKLP